MADSSTASINVQVVYALPDRQDMVSIKLAAGSTLQRAVEVSGLLQKYPEIDTASGVFGIYARICSPDTVLRDSDRIEIYRPLIADPKEVRRKRSVAVKSMDKAAGAGVEPPSA